MKFDVFICHCALDKSKVVDPLIDACTKEGLRVWVDSREIDWGDSIAEQINHGLNQSRCVLIVISEHTNTRQWQSAEISAAINAEIASGTVCVLPLYVGDRQSLEQHMPLLADKHGLSWNNDPQEIAERLKQRIGGNSEPHDKGAPRPYVPQLNPAVTDIERNQFLKNAFVEICAYFEHAAAETRKSQPRIVVEAEFVDREKFRCYLYLDGESVNQCNIWITSMGRSRTINFFSGRFASNEFNTSNEMLTVTETPEALCLTGSMGQISGRGIEAASPEVAAASLWKWFTTSVEAR